MYLIFVASFTLLQEINDQKLIYSGKLLSDEQKLSEVIRSYKDVYQQHHIFHLVCANKNITKTPHKITTTVPVKETNANANATANTPQGVQTNTNDNELRQRHVASAAASAAAAAASAQLPYQQQQQQQLPQLSQHANAAYSWMQFLQRAGPQQVATNSSHHLAFQQQQHQQQAMMYNAWVQQWYAAYMQQMMQR